MRYELIPPSKFDAVIKYLRAYFPDEPLNVAVGLCESNKPCELLEQHNWHTLEDGISLMAFDENSGDITGVSLNGISRRGDIEKDIEHMQTIDNIKYHRIFGLMNTANQELDLFGKYDVESIFEIRMLSVSPNYRGHGIAKQLVSRSIDIAKTNGFKVIKTDATSYITQRIVGGLGFIDEKSIRYSDYKDENGAKIYDTKSPHDYYKIMSMLLE